MEGRRDRFLVPLFLIGEEGAAKVHRDRELSLCPLFLLEERMDRRPMGGTKGNNQHISTSPEKTASEKNPGSQSGTVIRLSRGTPCQT